MVKLWASKAQDGKDVQRGCRLMQLPLCIVHSPIVVAAGLWAGIVATIVLFRPVIGNLALVLLGPYLAWVSYASALTIWIWRNNPLRPKPKAV